MELPDAVLGQAIRLRILDFSGKTQKEIEVLHTGGTITLDATQLPSGIYWCQLQTINAVFTPVKIIIAH